MPGKRRRVTILDVASAAGVSKSTAGRVLTGEGAASPETTERVRAAAKDLGYTPNSLARAMVSGRTDTLGLIVTDISSSFFSTVARGFSDVARTEGFEVFLASVERSHEVEERTVEAFLQKQVDGVAIAPVVRTMTSPLSLLTAAHTPLVLLDRPHPAAPDAPVIMLDHEDSARRAVERLIELGHSRIAVVTDTDTASRTAELVDGTPERSSLIPSELRLLGYLETLTAYGITPDPELVIGAGYTRRQVRGAVAERLRGDDRPTAVFATDALLSSGTYRALIDEDLTLPDDMSFIAFDDQEWCTMVQPEITTVTQPQYNLGADAARVLIDSIRGVDTETGRILLPAGFIERGSTGPPPPHRPDGAPRRMSPSR
jgi:LacI family transcriptional regulator